MDKSPPDVSMERMSVVISSTRGVKHFHKLKVRRAGNKLLVELHVQVSPRITIQRGHHIAHIVEKRLVKEFPNIKEVSIHVEPNIPGEY